MYTKTETMLKLTALAVFTFTIPGLTFIAASDHFDWVFSKTYSQNNIRLSAQLRLVSIYK